MTAQLFSFDEIAPPPRLVVAPYGPPADDALADAITAAKAGDPLAPVTVAVPSTLCGLSVRRRFAWRPLGAPGPGLVNVRFIVLARVAELLGAPRLAAQGRQPLSHAVRLHAVRVALIADPGRLAGVVDHPDTLAAVDATLRDLRKATDGARGRIATLGPGPAHAVRLYNAFRAATVGDWYDDDDLAEAASDAVSAHDAALDDVGTVVLHLPRRLSPAQLMLLGALAEAARLRAVIATSGDAQADDAAHAIIPPLQDMLGLAGGVALATPTGAVARAHASAVVRAGDPDDEVRTALRGVVERLERDVPLHRIAIVWRANDPYALIVHEQLAAADIPYSGPGARTLAQTLAGRTLLGALALPEHDFAREQIFTWLSSAPVLLRDDARILVPATRFEALAVESAVVSGLDAWHRHLDVLAARLAARHSELAADPDDERATTSLRRVGRDIEMVRQLRAFVADLGATLQPPTDGSWLAFSRWARRILERFLGEPGGDWPASEYDAFEAVLARVDALAALDAVGRATLAHFMHALEQELSAPAQRAGRFSDGVFVGRVGDAVGMSFDTIFVLGMADGSFPPPTNDDPLIPDRIRAVVGNEMPQRAERRADERRDWLAALASADERIISTPHADPRAQRERLPARWLLEELSHLNSDFTVGADDLDHLRDVPWFRDVPSFESGIRAAPSPVSQPERDLQMLLAAHHAAADQRASARAVEQHPLVATDRELVNGFAAQAGRRSRSITRWSGLVGRDVSDARAAWSSSRIQTLARCPFQFFLGSVLDVAEPTTVNAADVIDPADRGHLVHRCLERFLEERLSKPPAPDEAWSSEDHGRLRTIAAEEFAEAERCGLTGRPLLWRLEQGRILAELERTLLEDDVRRRAHHLVPHGVEVSFGDDNDPVAVALSDGVPVRFTGRIDRVDRVEGTDTYVVVDYKTGKADDYKPLLKDDPVNRGTQIQLPVYGLGARVRFAATSVRAAFWFVTKRGQFQEIGYPVDDAPLARLRSVLDVLVGLMRSGRFPARPGEAAFENDFKHCHWCPYTTICPPDRARRWEFVREDDSLAPYVALAERDGDDGDNGDDL